MKETTISKNNLILSRKKKKTNGSGSKKTTSIPNRNKNALSMTFLHALIQRHEISKHFKIMSRI